MSIQYAREETLSAEDFIDVLRRSGLAERRPVDEPDRIARMLQNADLICTARDTNDSDRLVGVSRCITFQAVARGSLGGTTITHRVMG